MRMTENLNISVDRKELSSLQVNQERWKVISGQELSPLSVARLGGEEQVNLIKSGWEKQTTSKGSLKTGEELAALGGAVNVIRMERLGGYDQAVKAVEAREAKIKDPTFPDVSDRNFAVYKVVKLGFDYDHLDDAEKAYFAGAEDLQTVKDGWRKQQWGLGALKTGEELRAITGPRGAAGIDDLVKDMAALSKFERTLRRNSKKRSELVKEKTALGEKFSITDDDRNLMNPPEENVDVIADLRSDYMKSDLLNGETKTEEPVKEETAPASEASSESAPAGDDLGLIPDTSENEGQDEGTVPGEGEKSEADNGSIPGENDEGKDEGKIPDVDAGKTTPEPIPVVVTPAPPKVTPVVTPAPAPAPTSPEPAPVAPETTGVNYEMEMDEQSILELGYFANFDDLSERSGNLNENEQAHLDYTQNYINEHAARYQAWQNAGNQEEVITNVLSFLTNERNTRFLKPGEHYTYDVLTRLLDQGIKGYYSQNHAAAPEPATPAPAAPEVIIPPAPTAAPAPETVIVPPAPAVDVNPTPAPKVETTNNNGSKTENLVGLPHATQFEEFMTLSRTPQHEGSAGAARLKELGKLVNDNFDEFSRWRKIDREVKEQSK